MSSDEGKFIPSNLPVTETCKQWNKTEKYTKNSLCTKVQTIYVNIQF